MCVSLVLAAALALGAEGDAEPAAPAEVAPAAPAEPAEAAEAAPPPDGHAEIARLERLVGQLLDERNKPAEVGPDDLPPRLDTRFRGYAQVGLAGSSVGAPIAATQADLALGVDANLGKDKRFVMTLRLPVGVVREPGELINDAFVDLALGRAMRLRIGKIYSPYGYWNTNVPFGDWNAPTPTRPGVLAFEEVGGSFATRQGGIDLVGEHELGDSLFGYHVGVGNGRSPHLLSTDVFGGKEFGGAAWSQVWFQTPFGLQIGLSGAADLMRASEIEGVGELSRDTTEVLAAGHAAWLRPHTEILAEVFVIGHHSHGVEGFVWNQSGYLQVAHRFGLTTPFIRADYVEKWAKDPVYTDLGDRRSALLGTVGLRRDLTPHLRLRLEASGGRTVRYEDGPSNAMNHVAGALYVDAAL